MALPRFLQHPKTLYNKKLNVLFIGTTLTFFRFRKFLLYMGTPLHSVRETRVNAIFKTIAEFSLEYRTCRDKIVQQKKRIQDKRERNKTRGKLIIDTKQWSSVANGALDDAGTPVDQKKHAELSKVLKTKTIDDGCNSFPGARLRSRKSTDDLISNGHWFQQKKTLMTSGFHMNFLGSGASYPSRHSGPPALDSQDIGDDEILDGLVKAATIHTDHLRERRRARHFNRKSLRRTRTLKLGDGEDGDQDSEIS